MHDANTLPKRVKKDLVLRVNDIGESVRFELEGLGGGEPTFKPRVGEAYHIHYQPPYAFARKAETEVQMKGVRIVNEEPDAKVALYCECGIRIVLPEKHFSEAELRDHFSKHKDFPF